MFFIFVHNLSDPVFTCAVELLFFIAEYHGQVLFGDVFGSVI